jgi:uncharacterized protein DUF4386
MGGSGSRDGDVGASALERTRVTRRTAARVAGFTFLLYIVAGVAPMAVPHGPLFGTVASLAACFSALVLGVTLYAVTRDQDPTLALLGLICRTGEGLLGAMFMPARLALRSLGDAPSSAVTPEMLSALNAFFASARSWNVVVAAMFFAVGSALFSWLFLRGRTIPAALAWLGVSASVLLVVCLPLQLAGTLTGPVTMIVWLPILVFELWLAFWLLIKGVAATTHEQKAAA